MQLVPTVHFTSLGCSKNLVDSQVMLGHLGLGGFKITTNPEEAQVIIVNTCSFVEAAKKESIDTILDLADFKTDGKCRALVVSGCMAQRYSKDLEESLPEVDLFIGTGEYHKIVTYLRALDEGKLKKKSFVEIPRYIHTEFDPRLNTSPSYSAWLKVSEGCNRNCTFCIIPTIRGTLRSRTVASLVTEAQKLAQSGVKELNVISQDLSNYGFDLDRKTNNLYELLDGLEKVEGVEWVRLFYYYPDDLTDEVIEKIATSKKVCKYIDMPVQHFADPVLKRMNRKITGSEILSKVEKLRARIPEIIIRTSLIVGFPGETEEDFKILKAGIEKAQFDHLGVFKYSDEEGTPAFKLKDKVAAETIEKRFEQIYELQQSIVRTRNARLIGKTVSVLYEGVDENLSIGRFEGQAPEIDGQVIINNPKLIDLVIGKQYSVKISEVLDYDLVGELL